MMEDECSWSGWLRKSGQRHTSWKVRFFRLFPATKELAYYKNIRDTKAIKRIDLNSATGLVFFDPVLKDEEMVQKMGVFTPKRTWMMELTDVEQRDMMTAALNAAMLPVSRVIRTSYFTKCGGGIRTWKRRWCVFVSTGQLLYFTDRSLASLKGHVWVHEAELVKRSERTDNPSSLAVEMHVDDRVHIFCLDEREGEETLQDWVQLLGVAKEGSAVVLATHRSQSERRSAGAMATDLAKERERYEAELAAKGKVEEDDDPAAAFEAARAAALAEMEDDDEPMSEMDSITYVDDLLCGCADKVAEATGSAVVFNVNWDALLPKLPPAVRSGFGPKIGDAFTALADAIAIAACAPCVSAALAEAAISNIVLLPAEDDAAAPLLLTGRQLQLRVPAAQPDRELPLRSALLSVLAAATDKPDLPQRAELDRMRTAPGAAWATALPDWPLTVDEDSFLAAGVLLPGSPADALAQYIYARMLPTMQSAVVAAAAAGAAARPVRVHALSEAAAPVAVTVDAGQLAVTVCPSGASLPACVGLGEDIAAALSA